MIQSEDLLIYCAQNSLARGERNGKLKDKSRQNGDQTSDFSKIWCGVGLQNPNGSKSQIGQGISPWVGDDDIGSLEDWDLSGVRQFRPRPLSIFNQTRGGEV